MDEINGIMNEQKALYLFIDYLVKKGIDKNLIALNYKLKPNISADIVVIDDKTNIPIMLFELKMSRTSDTEEKGKRFLKKIRHNFPYSNLPLFLVFYNPNTSSSFDVLLYDTEKNCYVESKLFEETVKDFEHRKVARISEAKNEKELKKLNIIENFSILCWCIAFVVISIFAYTKFAGYTILTTDLIISGAIISIILLPFASKINFLGVEVERSKKLE